MPSLSRILLMLAIVVGTVQFYSIARHFHMFEGGRYTYLQQEGSQFRVDNSAGRTDRLTKRGEWIPVSFDKPPETIDEITGILIDDGSWSSARREICFVVTNHTQYVLSSVRIRIIFAENSEGKAAAGWLVGLKPIGLLNVGQKGILCGNQPIVLPEGKTWAYSFVSAEGWKQATIPGPKSQRGIWLLETHEADVWKYLPYR